MKLLEDTPIEGKELSRITNALQKSLLVRERILMELEDRDASAPSATRPSYKNAITWLEKQPIMFQLTEELRLREEFGLRVAKVKNALRANGDVG